MSVCVCVWCVFVYWPRSRARMRHTHTHTHTHTHRQLGGTQKRTSLPRAVLHEHMLLKVLTTLKLLTKLELNLLNPKP